MISVGSAQFSQCCVLNSLFSFFFFFEEGVGGGVGVVDIKILQPKTIGLIDLELIRFLGENGKPVKLFGVNFIIKKGGTIKLVLL